METFLGHTIRTHYQGGPPSGNHSQGGRPRQVESNRVDARTDAQVNTGIRKDKKRERHNAFRARPSRYDDSVQRSESAAVPFVTVTCFAQHPPGNALGAFQVRYVQQEDMI